METFTTQDLIAELQEYQLTAVPRREGGVTINEWAQAQEISETAARKQLRRLMTEGILEREWTLDGGNRMYVYYRIEKK
jgi:predicted transcriptional regulator